MGNTEGAFTSFLKGAEAGSELKKEAKSLGLSLKRRASFLFESLRGAGPAYTADQEEMK